MAGPELKGSKSSNLNQKDQDDDEASVDLPDEHPSLTVKTTNAVKNKTGPRPYTEVASIYLLLSKSPKHSRSKSYTATNLPGLSLARPNELVSRHKTSLCDVNAA